MSTPKTTTREVADHTSGSLAQCVLGIVEEHQAQVLAVVLALERSLGEACRDGVDPADDAPLNDWRLAQVLRNMVESDALMRSLGEVLVPRAART